jgi:hypothetical protein
MFDKQNFSEKLQQAVENLKNIINEVSIDEKVSIIIMANTEAKEEISGEKESTFNMAVVENIDLNKMKQVLKACFKNEDNFKLLFVKAMFDVITDDMLDQSKIHQMENMFKKLSELSNEENE